MPLKWKYVFCQKTHVGDATILTSIQNFIIADSYKQEWRWDVLILLLQWSCSGWLIFNSFIGKWLFSTDSILQAYRFSHYFPGKYADELPFLVLLFQTLTFRTSHATSPELNHPAFLCILFSSVFLFVLSEI